MCHMIKRLMIDNSAYAMAIFGNLSKSMQTYKGRIQNTNRWSNKEWSNKEYSAFNHSTIY